MSLNAWYLPLAGTLSLGLALSASPAWGGAQTADSDWPLRDRIDAAASYLHAQIGQDGRMVYRRDAITGASQTEQRYNVLRHAGSLLALAEYHAEVPPDPSQVRAVQSSFDFLNRCCLRPSRAGADDLALWSDPALVGGQRQYAVAKLGGAGLGLAAMAQWRQVHPGGIDLGKMQALGRFLLSMQGDNGRFQSLHAEHTGQHDPDWVSLYYPGEAALGLVMLYEHDGDIRWLQAALDALLALARQREGQASVPPDHWALLATARLWRLEPGELQEALPEGLSWLSGGNSTAVAPLLMTHAIAVTKTMLDQQQIEGAPRCALGGFTPEGRSTPTATRLEGLIAILPLLREHVDGGRIQGAVQRGMAFLLAAQRSGQAAAGAFTRVSAACPSDDPRAHEVRIDYVQHALSAMQAYGALLQSSDLP